MTPRNRLLIAAACLASLGTAGWIASGDAPGRGMESDIGNPITAKSPKPAEQQSPRTATMQAGTFDPFCIKCDGAMSAPLTDDDIRAAGDAAEILVLGLSEPHGAVEPVWHDWTPTSYTVPDVPPPAMPGGHAWPASTPRDTPWLYVPGHGVSPVPDAPAWSAMLIGFGAVGLMFRRKRDRL